ncbi:MAG: type II toxin-antitoxin system RatA family toxin [Pseudomonadota bacterium]|nr:type II toxin-antitoxin system RatA family toxin [Pseudomonadota bacterium]
MKRIARSAIVEASADQLYALVDDIEAYPRFLPWCKDAQVHSRGAAGTRATLTAGLGGLRQSFTTLNQGRPVESIEMRLVRGPFRHFAASWRFTPLFAGACKVDFSLEYEFASRALGKLLEPLFHSIADSMVDAFTRRALERHGS